MQLAGERIFKALGVKVRPVPFGGAGETAKNFLGGHVTFYGGSIPPIMPHIKAGKAKALLLTSAADNEVLPTASGLKALGIPQEETVFGAHHCSQRPADRGVKNSRSRLPAGGIPAAFQEFLKEQGEESVIAGPAEVNKLIREEYKALGEVAKDIGLKK